MLSIKKIVSVLLCAVMLVACANISVYAYTKDEVQKEIAKLEQQSQEITNKINKLKKDKSAQSVIKAELDKNIAILQKQIDICNQKISESNAAIAANEKEMLEQEAKISGQILDYKKRIRALYMSGSTISGIEVLLGAEDFADFIALSQVSLNISRRDKKMIENIVEVIEKIKEKSAENEVLIKEQKEIKATLDKKQDKLDAQVAEVNKIISGINSNISNQNHANSQLQKEIKEWERVMNELSAPPQNNSVFDGMFTWPVPGFTNRTSDYGPRWNRKHAGIDISQSGIRNAKVVSIASGTVKVWCNTCTHNYGKYSNGSIYSCGCGGGYGNYVSVDHGTYKGISYRSVYAHLSSVTVSTGQKVNKGTKLGTVGTTGRSSGYHLHFEIRENGVAVNPMKYY